MTTPAREDMPTPACWDEIRGGVAFLVAPAMVPIVSVHDPQQRWLRRGRCFHDHDILRDPERLAGCTGTGRPRSPDVSQAAHVGLAQHQASVGMSDQAVLAIEN